VLRQKYKQMRSIASSKRPVFLKQSFLCGFHSGTLCSRTLRPILEITKAIGFFLSLFLLHFFCLSCGNFVEDGLDFIMIYLAEQDDRYYQSRTFRQRESNP